MRVRPTDTAPICAFLGLGQQLQREVERRAPTSSATGGDGERRATTEQCHQSPADRDLRSGPTTVALSQARGSGLEFRDCAERRQWSS